MVRLRYSTAVVVEKGEGDLLFDSLPQSAPVTGQAQAMMLQQLINHLRARLPLLAWRLALYCILITLWMWPGGLRQRYASQVRSSGHPNPRFAVFRMEIIPVLLIAFSEYSTWTQ